jgi:geranylgeranyl diphosphate synthase type II
MDYFRSQILRLTKLIDGRLDRYLPPETKEPAILHKAMRYSVFSGGKRLRPVIVLESAKICGGKIENALPAACAVELIHTYSLIHDDLPAMDDDDHRRGKPSCHKKFGESTAILAGDALLTMAFGIIASDLKPKIASSIANVLSKAAGSLGMVGGQTFDLKYKDKNKNRGVSERINRLKTAKLFEAASSIGAIAASANKAKVEALAAYGLNFGIAFQMADDMTDGEGGFSPEEVRRFIVKARSSIKILGAKADALNNMADSVGCA